MTKKRMIVYAATVIASIMLIWLGNQYTTRGLYLNGNNISTAYEEAVVQMIDISAQADAYGSTSDFIYFRAQMTNPAYNNRVYEAVQVIIQDNPVRVKQVEPGDHVIISTDSFVDEVDWQFVDYKRSDALIYLGAVFAICLILFGRGKGLSTVFSLAFTCLSIFLVFVPAVLNGKNIYLWSMLLSIFIIGMTLLLVSGANKKSLAAALGCVGGVLAAWLLIVIMDSVLQLTGLLDEDYYYLLDFNANQRIDIKAVIFSGMILSTIGAIMDVAVNVSASLCEIEARARAAADGKRMSHWELFRSGVTIGRDTIGTMSNTLVLAYVGSSLASVLLICAYNSFSMLWLFNRESIVVEILQALIGSMGMLLTIPLTAFITAFLIGDRHRGSAILPSGDTSAEPPTQSLEEPVAAGSTPDSDAVSANARPGKRKK